jgi:hypothetical protein
VTTNDPEAFSNYLFRAKGAVSCQTGATPQESKSPHEQALKARFNGAAMNGAFSADVLGNYESWSVPQSADECCAFGATDTQLSSLLRLKLTWTGSTLGLESRSLALSKL